MSSRACHRSNCAGTSKNDGRRASSPVHRDIRFDDLAGAVRVDVNALPPVARHHDEFGGEAGTLDVKLKPVAAGIADRGTARAPCPLGPAAAHLILVVGGELADEIEIVTVACAPELELDVAGAAPRAVGRVASNALGGTVFGTQRPAAGPTPGKFRKWPRLRVRGR